MTWISDVSQQDFCPKCNFAKVNYLVPDLSPPYIKYLPEMSYDNEHRRDYLLAENIYEQVNHHLKDGRARREGKKLRIVAYIDSGDMNYMTMLEKFAEVWNEKEGK
mmetsp:Transcript_40577/g.61835  ORF Transcript_40577/g.61835 Transcript_40577/m.61835 type:complete len:106 (-) Transcript_40577:210-527(-)